MEVLRTQLLWVRKLIPMIEGNTLRDIRDAVKGGLLKERFRAAEVNIALTITYAGVFLPKHRVGNPGGNTALFVEVSRGLYRLK